MCLRTDIVSGKLPLLGQGIWWIPLPSSSQGICRAAGQTLCVPTRPLVPGEALCQVHRPSPNTHRGKHRSGGAKFNALPGNRSLSAFFALFLPFSPFPEGPRSMREIQKAQKKSLFPQISSDLLSPDLLNPHLWHATSNKMGRRPPNLISSAPEALVQKQQKESIT